MNVARKVSNSSTALNVGRGINLEESEARGREGAKQQLAFLRKMAETKNQSERATSARFYRPPFLPSDSPYLHTGESIAVGTMERVE